MSIWTSRRGAAGLAAVLLLSGCLAAPDVARRDTGFARKATDTVAVAGDAVVIGGPPGYCIDRAASRIGGQGAFVLLGSCASITRDANAGAPPVPGLLTASVDGGARGGPTAAPDPEQMAAFMASAEGRAALARDGRAESVQVLDTVTEDGALFIRLRDTSGAKPDLSQEYWRGLFEVNGRLVTVSVVGFADRPLSVEAGLATLRAFYARIRAETLKLAVADAPKPGKGLFPFLLR